MKKVGIFGATGYTGEELLRVLSRYPGLSVAFATSEREQGRRVVGFFPHLPSYDNLSFSSAQDATKMDADLVFLCLPPGKSAQITKSFFDRNIKVLDLGADFRYNSPESYTQWCELEHPFPELISESVYGLPEWNREKIKSARIVSNPGCYPTSVLLAMIPFLKANVLAPGPILVDSKSGVSGAGSSPTKTTHFGEANESLSAYKPGRVHRHVGEMEQQLAEYHQGAQVIFAPHLTPMFRGILSTIYVRLLSEINHADIKSILDDAYQNEPFVNVLDEKLPSTKMAANSNFCFLAVKTIEDSNTAIVFSAIDNLGKGASWQAVQNMNLMLGFSETMGLT